MSGQDLNFVIHDEDSTLSWPVQVLFCGTPFSYRQVKTTQGPKKVPNQNRMGYGEICTVCKNQLACIENTESSADGATAPVLATVNFFPTVMLPLSSTRMLIDLPEA